MQNIIPVIAALAGSLITGVITLAAGWITTKKTRSNLVWELRKESFTTILKRLKEASERATIVDNGYNSGTYGPDPHNYFESPNRTEQEQTEGNAWKSCCETFD